MKCDDEDVLPGSETHLTGGTVVRVKKMDNCREEDGLQLGDLPDHLLVEVASFLGKECRALWAVSMGAPSEHWTTSSTVSAIGKQILTLQRESWREEWREFDFGSFQHQLDFCSGERKDTELSLSDDDLQAVLICIDAATNVESLRLTRFRFDHFGSNRPVKSRLTGRGLAPLSGSTVLRRIDISLVGEYHYWSREVECNLELGEVLPVLDSIVGSDGNKLCHIQFPKKWRDAKHESLSRFIARYNDMLDTRVRECCQCDALACKSICYHLYLMFVFSHILPCSARHS